MLLDFDWKPNNWFPVLFFPQEEGLLTMEKASKVKAMVMEDWMLRHEAMKR